MKSRSSIQTGSGPVSITSTNHGFGWGARLGGAISDRTRFYRQSFKFFYRGDDDRSRDHEAEYVPGPSRGVR